MKLCNIHLVAFYFSHEWEIKNNSGINYVMDAVYADFLYIIITISLLLSVILSTLINKYTIRNKPAPHPSKKRSMTTGTKAFPARCYKYSLIKRVSRIRRMASKLPSHKNFGAFSFKMNRIFL